MLRRLLASVLLLFTTAVELRGQQARLDIAPASPLPGALVRLTLADPGAARDSFVAVTGTNGKTTVTGLVTSS